MKHLFVFLILSVAISCNTDSSKMKIPQGSIYQEGDIVYSIDHTISPTHAFPDIPLDREIIIRNESQKIIIIDNGNISGTFSIKSVDGNNYTVMDGTILDIEDSSINFILLQKDPQGNNVGDKDHIFKVVNY